MPDFEIGDTFAQMNQMRRRGIVGLGVTAGRNDTVNIEPVSCNFFIVLLSDENKAVGFISYWEWNDFSYVEHFAVDSSCRGSGYGATAMTELLKRINNPAVLEVEKPLDNISQRRIRFYERLGFVLCTRSYTQPPYSPEKQPLELYLMSFGKIDLNQVFDTVASRIHQKVYGVE